jgi:hypothetical protein
MGRGLLWEAWPGLPILQPARPDTARDLYDRDWYAWTQDQAARLRAWPEHLRPNGLDVEHLAEEVEDLGGSQRRAVESHLRLIALHLLKLEFHPARDSRGHWVGEVAAFRDTIGTELRDSPSLRGRCPDLYPAAWRRARRAFLDQIAADQPDLARTLAAALPEAAPPRYDLALVLAEGWYPDPAAA